ncbi:unnamed protein product, partial [Ectocarpus fasciculatus]
AASASTFISSLVLHIFPCTTVPILVLKSRDSEESYRAERRFLRGFSVADFRENNRERVPRAFHLLSLEFFHRGFVPGFAREPLFPFCSWFPSCEAVTKKSILSPCHSTPER